MQPDMKYIFSFLTLFLFSLLGAQQNLVPNPSFEADTGAPVITQFNWNRYADWKRDSLTVKAGNQYFLAKDWFQPTGGTPDFLNSKSSWLLGWKTKTAKTGKGRMAIIGGLSKNSLVNWIVQKNTYAEYIECRLKKPLEPGKTYCVRYFVALDKKSNYACHRFGAVISRDCVDIRNTKASLSGDYPYAQVIASDDHYITSDEGWVMVCDTFVAKGGELYLMLGSFAGEYPLHVHKAKKSQHGSLRVAPFNKYAYYYVDDVSLTEVGPGQPMCMAPRDSTNNDHIVFVLDASGSMQAKGLLDEAKDALLPLVSSLPPNNRITIIAYSDVPQVVAREVRASDTAALREALAKIRSGGSSNITSAFRETYEIIRSGRGKGSDSRIIVLTDGKIYLNKTEKQKIIDASEKEGIHVSVIFFGEQVPDEVVRFAEDAGGQGKAASGENAADVIRNEVGSGAKDTPYGERNAGKIALWTFFTKIFVPGLAALLVMRAVRVI